MESSGARKVSAEAGPEGVAAWCIIGSVRARAEGRWAGLVPGPGLSRLWIVWSERSDF